MIKPGKMLAVIGGQFGSEGKGAVIGQIADDYQVHVRVGSPNAGHTFYWNGEKHVMQTIPCGWINPEATIVIGRGALLDMELLLVEISRIEKYYPKFKDRLVIDELAGVLDKKFHQEEGGVDGEIHRRIGSTGEGVGAARVARVNRDPSVFRHFWNVCDKYGLTKCCYKNTPKMLNEWQESGLNILLEGTQGSGLSLLHGYWPYVTSIDTNAAQILAECGIAPNKLGSVLLVCRTFPIRVAGTSGPLYRETSWEALSAVTGRSLSEVTTVTKKTRRVGMWDWKLVENSVILNNPSSIALTFVDYIDGCVEGVTEPESLTQPVLEVIDEIESRLNVRISMVGTGPKTMVRLSGV